MTASASALLLPIQAIDGHSTSEDEQKNSGYSRTYTESCRERRQAQAVAGQHGFTHPASALQPSQGQRRTVTHAGVADKQPARVHKADCRPYILLL